MRDDVRPKAYRKTEIAHREERDCAHEREKLGAPVNRFPKREGEPNRDNRDGTEQGDVGPGEPALHDLGL